MAEDLLTTSKLIVSPLQALRQAIAEYPSGRLTICPYNNHLRRWRIYFSQGHINFAESAIGQTERLSYLLQRYFPTLELPSSLEGHSSYFVLSQLLRSAWLSFEQAQELADLSTQEALPQILAMPKVSMQLEPTLALDPLLLSLSLPELIYSLRESICQWNMMHAEISSPFQKPFMKNWDKFVGYLSCLKKQPQTLLKLSDTFSENTCLYQLAQLVSMDVTDLAVLLHPFIKIGAIGVNPYSPEENVIRPVVACIQHKPVVQRLIKRVLESAGYEVLAVMDANQLLTHRWEQPPQLILMDADLPQVDSRVLCKQIRQKTEYYHTPIIMLIQSSGLFDRLRTCLSGAVDYLIKPIRPQELLALAHKFIPTPSLNPHVAT